jgi:hypothetical protein
MRSRTNQGLKHTKWGVEIGCARPRGRDLRMLRCCAVLLSLLACGEAVLVSNSLRFLA